MGACMSTQETKGGSNAAVEEIKTSNKDTIEEPKKRTKVVADSYDNSTSPFTPFSSGHLERHENQRTWR